MAQSQVWLRILQPALERVLLLDPRRCASRLAELRRASPHLASPNTWQLALGVCRVWLRLVQRPDSMGTCARDPVRNTPLAKLLANRAIRVPTLIAMGAVTPWDLTGLLAKPTTVARHLMLAHHDANQFIYDLELLAYGGDLLALQRALAEFEQDASQAWMKDVAIFEGYHAHLRLAVDRITDSGIALTPEERADPDLTLEGFLAWCAMQPPTLAATMQAHRRRELKFTGGLELGHRGEQSASDGTSDGVW